MLFSNVAQKSAQLSETQQVTRSTGRLMTRKVWLPKTLYNALPGFYLIAGVCALLATIYISGWAWVLPHYLLFSIACLHMGILVYRRRHKPKS